MKKILKSQKGFSLIEILVVVIIIAILAGLAIPMYFQYVDRAKSLEAQTALSAIRGAFNIHFQQYGSTDNYSIDDALQDARLGRAATKNWKFEVVGNPPQRYVATSTSDFSSGEGRQIWYDVEEAKFFGWGIDRFTETDY